MDETLHQSQIKNRTRSKSRKVVVPEPLLPSASEGKGPRPQLRKHSRASPAPLRAGGHAKYFRRNSNQFPIIASKKLAVRKTYQGFPSLALLAAPKGEWPTSELRPLELPRLARPKGCFTAYYARSIDELSRRTTGRLGYDRPDSAYAIGGTAELAL